MKKFAADIRKVLDMHGVIISEHHILSSGLHTDTKFDMELLYEVDPQISTMLYRLMADDAHAANLPIDYVVGIETGGIFMAEHVAGQLSARMCHSIPWVIAKKGKKPGTLTFSSEDWHLLKQSHVFLVDDVTTSGRSLFEGERLIESLGSSVSGMGVLCNRSSEVTEFHTDFFYVSYIDSEAKLWTAEQCPLCKTTDHH